GYELLIRGKYFTGSALCFEAAARGVILPIPAGLWHDQWIALVLSLAWPGRVTLVDRILYAYRQHENNQIGARRGSFARRAWKEVRSYADVRSEVQFFASALERFRQLAGRMAAGNEAAHQQAMLEQGLMHAQRRYDYIEGRLRWMDVLRPQRFRQ